MWDSTGRSGRWHGKNWMRRLTSGNKPFGPSKQREQAAEFGDLLFSLVNVGRLLNLNAEDSLRQANKKFDQAFSFIEQKLKEQDRSLDQADLEEMDRYWNEAKVSGSL